MLLDFVVYLFISSCRIYFSVQHFDDNELSLVVGNSRVYLMYLQCTKFTGILQRGMQIVVHDNENH